MAATINISFRLLQKSEAERASFGGKEDAFADEEATIKQHCRIVITLSSLYHIVITLSSLYHIVIALSYSDHFIIYYSSMC